MAAEGEEETTSRLQSVKQAVCAYTIDSLCNWVSCCNCCKKRRSGYSKVEISEKELKDELQYHFMSPFKRICYSQHKTIPWKLIVQITSIIFVTIQLTSFATTKFYVTDLVHENTQTFTHLFVANPVKTFGPFDPPPSPISYLYTTDDVLDQINFTANAYFNLQSKALGAYGYEWPSFGNDLSNYRQLTNSQRHLVLKITKYGSGKIDPTYMDIDLEKETVEQYYINETDVHNPNTTHPTTDAINWSKLVDEMILVKAINLKFNITSVSIADGNAGDHKCFQFTLLFAIKKDYDSGNMPMTLDVQTVIRDCRNGSKIRVFDTSFKSTSGKVAEDVIVVIISFIFIVLCGRSLIRTLYLTYIARKLLKEKIPKDKYSWKIFLPLLDKWHIMVIVSNILAFIGSILKLLLSHDVINDVRMVDITSIILGLAVFGQWCGLLRFLSYFDKYNMLLLTLKISAPSVLRFIVCTGILYIAFLLCGWLVMGPYHPKFRTIYLTSECLFSLINGDDMFNTFIQLSDSTSPVTIFAKIYLYAFVALFIYVVLSVFISLIEDTYRTLQEEWNSAAGRKKEILFSLYDFAYAKGQASDAKGHCMSCSTGTDSETEMQDVADSLV